MFFRKAEHMHIVYNPYTRDGGCCCCLDWLAGESIFNVKLRFRLYSKIMYYSY